MKNNKVNFETIMFLISSSLLLNCFCGYIAYISSVESGVFYDSYGGTVNIYPINNGILKGIVILIVLAVISLLSFILMKRKTIISNVKFNIPYDAKIVLLLGLLSMFISYIYINVRRYALSNSILSFLAGIGNEYFINSFLISLMSTIALYISTFILKDLIKSFKNEKLIIEDFALYKIFNSTKTVFKKNKLMNFIIKGSTVYLALRVSMVLISMVIYGNVYYIIFAISFFDILILFLVLAPIGIKLLRETWFLYNKSNSLLLGTKYNKKIKSLYLAETFNNLDGLKLSLDKAYKENVKEENFKSQLITNISHDIRTPLTSIINYVDILRNKDVTDEERDDYTNRINKNSLRLKALIDTLNTAEYKLELKEIDLSNLIIKEIDNYSGKLKENNLTLRTNIIKEAIILGDEKGCHRIIQNIFTNIMKYAMEGTRVYLEMREEFDKIVLSVKNVSKYPLDITGEEALQRFTRGDKSRNTEGAGLGLSIVKSLMDSQEGEVKVDIDGDLFKITLEFEKGKR